MPTRILLVRHGATTSSADERFAGSSDVELSAEGAAQVRALGERLRGVRIDAAYCSTMHRAIATCQAVAGPHGLTPIRLAALREIDHGHWEGLPHKQVESRFAAEYAAWSADPLNTIIPGGESGASVLKRALEAIGQIVREHDGQSVLIVSHKATNRLLISQLMGMDPRRYRDRLAQDLACLNILDFRSPEDAQLVVLNETFGRGRGPAGD
jgi:probable phosphoglycerate mutase